MVLTARKVAQGAMPCGVTPLWVCLQAGGFLLTNLRVANQLMLVIQIGPFSDEDFSMPQVGLLWVAEQRVRVEGRPV